MSGLTVLHTSDWHLGHQLYRKRRDQEFAAFFDWLSQTLHEKKVDVLLVAGDVFDVGNPGTGAQQLYYAFLAKIVSLGVRHVVIVAGNHDSPAFLNAPSTVLENLDIHVIGTCGAQPEDEILVLRDAGGKPEMLVCAAPFLREGDICRFIPGESHAEKDQRLLDGLRQHFERLAETAAGMRAEYGDSIPVIATAHLFTAGVEDEKEDSVRDIYRGNMGCIPLHYFPDTFDYVALGHIHKPYAVDEKGLRRYSGSPLPLTFAEAKYEKKVLLVHFGDSEPEVENITVPTFQKLRTIEGNSADILAQLAELAASSKNSEDSLWLEISHDGTDSPSGLPANCQAVVDGSNLEILCVKTSGYRNAPESLEMDRGLDDLEPVEMFRRCLIQQNVPEDEWQDLEASFQELYTLTIESDEQCES